MTKYRLTTYPVPHSSQRKACLRTENSVRFNISRPSGRVPGQIPCRRSPIGSADALWAVYRTENSQALLC